MLSVWEAHEKYPALISTSIEPGDASLGDGECVSDKYFPRLSTIQNRPSQQNDSEKWFGGVIQGNLRGCRAVMRKSLPSVDPT